VTRRISSGWVDWICFVANIDEEIFSRTGTTAMRLSMMLRRCSQGIGMANTMDERVGLKFLDYDNDGERDLIWRTGFQDDLVGEISHQVTLQGAAALVS